MKLPRLFPKIKIHGLSYSIERKTRSEYTHIKLSADNKKCFNELKEYNSSYVRLSCTGWWIHKKSIVNVT